MERSNTMNNATKKILASTTSVLHNYFDAFKIIFQICIFGYFSKIILSRITRDAYQRIYNNHAIIKMTTFLHIIIFSTL